MRGCCVFGLILGLLFISVAVAKKLWLLKGFAGLLPVNSCVLLFNSLIINAIHFCKLHAFAGNFCVEMLALFGGDGCCGNECGGTLGNYMLT